MTHDELLAKLSSTNRRYAGSQDNSALRAVVELHKPVSDGGCCGRDGELVCNSCPDDQIREGHNAIYPCPTIQAIEKELGQ